MVRWLLVVSVFVASRAWAQSLCPTRTPPPPPLVEDLNPNGPRPPPIQGPQWAMVQAEDLDPGDRALDNLFFFLGFGREDTTHSPRDSHTVILADSFVRQIREQDEVKNTEEIARQTTTADARQFIERLACDQHGRFSNRGVRGFTANEDSYGMHLAVGSFSVYWESLCVVNPKRCCIPKETCEPSGVADEITYQCNIRYTIYDNYNFSSKSGTGNTGLLKALNPIGWAGTSFHQYGYYNEDLHGRAHICLTVEEAHAKCCKPTRVQLPPPPPPPEPPVTDPTGPPRCPICTGAQGTLELHRRSLREAAERPQTVERMRDANRKTVGTVQRRLQRLEQEAKRGKWTEPGKTDATTRHLDASKRGNEIHVAIRDASGNVIERYTYRRSRNAAEIERKRAVLAQLLEALEVDLQHLDESETAAVNARRAGEASLPALQAAVDDCMRQCRLTLGPQQPTHVQREPRWTAFASAGVDLELRDEPTGPFFGGQLGYRVVPHGHVVFAPEIKLGDHQQTITLPIGFQYELALPMPRLFAYPRATVGYGLNRFDGGDRSFSSSIAVLGVAGGVHYVFDDRWRVALEPVGVTAFVGSGFTSYSYRFAIAGGARF